MYISPGATWRDDTSAVPGANGVDVDRQREPQQHEEQRNEYLDRERRKEFLRLQEQADLGLATSGLVFANRE